MLTEQKYLYCDQSASLTATIVHELGYETRLVDFVGSDNISHHTILEVNQQDTWKAYDTAYNLPDTTYEESAKYYGNGQYPAVRYDYRRYPGIYHWVIQNNYYLKNLSLWLRGAPG